ncbi:phosphoglycerate mutase-like protein [Coniochaeta ligniaria NRRL 30616]|uniref:Phosphoglycerate mutase-like protein n=1 Tax=Coniochaeta ligniaria NRRL 30616 TaxID=1408157 RepID=A0A1J7IN28_9PEZI|nr:phosphoglycerate mutase-like protein [Coniochaeta ligniaria NRRL 30616]
MVNALISSLSLVALAAQGSLAWKAGSECTSSYSYINYTSVPGFFVQDDPSSSTTNFDYTTSNFGLINQTYPTDANFTQCGAPATQWQRFAHYVNSLNAASPASVAYKVLFLARHGEGWHNAAETYYGTPAWNCYYSLLDGNGTAVWADALLTPAGVAQAVKANTFWRSQLSQQKMPAPQSYYSSPLSRCLITANITFGDLSLPAARPFVPTVKEFFREGISIHTCDRRRSKSYIHDLLPSWKFEDGFSETDLIWNGVTAEDSSGQYARSKVVLDEVFTDDEATWISVTSHSGEIGSLLSVLGHRSWSLSTGQAVPVLVKAERMPAPYPSKTIAAWSSAVTCAGPPVSSGAGGCVCSTGATALPTVV